jgi:hypothetical protein
MPEVSAEELAVLRGSAALLDGLWRSPKHGQSLKRAVKELNPNVSIPEVDVPDAVLAPVNHRLEEMGGTMAKINERLEAMDRAKSDAELDGKFRNSLDTAKKRFGLTDDGETAVLNLMRERQIADPEAAAALYTASLPKGKAAGLRDSSAYGGSSYSNLYGMRGGGSEMDELLARDPDAFFDREVANVLNEFADQA